MSDPKSLEDYLKENIKKGIIDFALRSTVNAKGVVSFYIHPASVSGETVDFVVKDNTLHGL